MVLSLADLLGNQTLAVVQCLFTVVANAQISAVSSMEPSEKSKLDDSALLRVGLVRHRGIIERDLSSFGLVEGECIVEVSLVPPCRLAAFATRVLDENLPHQRAHTA